MSSNVEVRVPDIGGAAGVKVIEVLVAVGDTVEKEQSLVTLESEKATMDVPSSAAGRVVAVHVTPGAEAAEGTLVVTLEVSGGAGADASREQARSHTANAPAPAASPATPASPAVTSSPVVAASLLATPAAVATPAPVVGASLLATPASAALPAINETTFAKAHASPSVRRFARELGVDLGQVRGSGQKGRVSHDDVKAWVKQTLAAAATRGAAGGSLPKLPEVDFAKFGSVRVVPLTRIQKISGPRLHASWVNLPHVTQFDQADITGMEATRQELKEAAAEKGVKLTPLAFVVRACARVIAKFPKFASSLDAAGENLVYKQYLHIGFAADTPNGLVVPVIRDADRKDVYEIARDLAELSAKARAGQLKAAEMQGGCFTISSLGGIGGTAFTPIINAPEVAILGVSKSSHQPHWDGKQFVPRLMLPLSLSYDHRVIDGADGARFTAALALELANVAGLLEAVP
jgi:pyruvate dehydrogenase E2 component (dihydrolipoamide acetyltransferase)